jgi:hypothetical protein
VVSECKKLVRTTWPVSRLLSDINLCILVGNKNRANQADRYADLASRRGGDGAGGA